MDRLSRLKAPILMVTNINVYQLNYSKHSILTYIDNTTRWLCRTRVCNAIGACINYYGDINGCFRM